MEEDARTIAVTSSPRLTSMVIKRRPMNPVPPVTRIFIRQ
jgi:hypothetical protein